MSDVIHDRVLAARPAVEPTVPGALRVRVLSAVRGESADDAPAPTSEPVRRIYPARHGSRRRWAGRGLPLVVAAVVGLGGVAAATGFVVSSATKEQATTLRHRPPGTPGGVGLRGAALVRELERLRSITPFPPGVHDTFPVRALEGTAAGSVEITVEQRADCYWQRYWLESTRRGATREAAAALKILHQIPFWPGYTTRYRGNRRTIAVDVAHQAQIGDVDGFARRMTTSCQGVFGAPRGRP